MSEIARLSENEADAAGGVLARAFQDDPPFVHFLPDAAGRASILPAFFSRFARYGALFGELQGAAGGRGFAIWLSEHEMSSERMKLAGLDELPRIFGEEGLGRLSEFLAFMGKVHHGAMSRKHWYLAFIGVEPVHQGQWIGSALLRPMLARADAEGLPCYLETFLDSNVSFYKKNGFDLTAEGVEPTSKCRYWTFLSRKR